MHDLDSGRENDELCFSVPAAKFGISDTPVFLNRLRKLQTISIRAFPAERRLKTCFVLTDKMPMSWVDEKISVGVTCHDLFEKP